MLGLGLGLTFQSGSNVNYNPANDPELVSLISARSGLTLADSKGSNPASILLPYIHRESAGTYAAVTDNGALDIGSSDFTMCGWVNDLTPTNGTYYGIFGKGVNVSTPGRYAFYTNATTRTFLLFVQTTGNQYLINSTVVSNTAGWKFLLMSVNQTTKKIYFYIDNVLVNAGGTTFTGTFPAMDNKFKFFLDGLNDTNGVTADRFTGHKSDVRIYNRLLTDPEMLTLFQRGDVSGAKAHYPLSQISAVDVSGNNYHPASSYLAANLNYSAYGSRHGLDFGYDVYKGSAYPDVHIPHKSDGTSISTTNLIAAYWKDISVPGDLAFHNRIDSSILFTHANWDRSNVTIYSDFARSAYHKYVVATPKLWHISVLTVLKIKLFKNAGYKGKDFVKYSANRLEEIISCSVDKTAANLRSTLKYSNNYEAYHDISYVFDARNIVATRGNYMLIMRANRYVDFYSDGGIVADHTYDAIGEFITCQFAYIYENGDCIFGFDNYLKYSHDGLATVHDVTKLDINGDPYTIATKGTFHRLEPDNYFKLNGVEMPVWGTYSTAAETYQIEVNGWYSVDHGVTVKSFIHWAGDGTFNSVGHIHGIYFNEIDSSFWVLTGDGDATHAMNKWIKCTYDAGTDTWTNVEQASSTSVGVHKTVGMTWKNGYAYWGADGGPTGIWRVPYADILTTAKYDRVEPFDLNGTVPAESIIGWFADEQNIIATYWKNYRGIAVSSDKGLSWYTHIIEGGPDLVAGQWGTYVNIQPKNGLGQYLIHIIGTGESVESSYMRNDVMLLKIDKP